MDNIAIFFLCALVIALCVLVFLLWRRTGSGRAGDMEQALMARLQQDLKMQFALQREEMNAQTARMVQILSADVGRMSEMQQGSLKGMSTQLVEMVRLNQTRLDEMRATLEKSLKAVSDENAKRLDEIRKTVDEQLHATLEKRLNQSFTLVSARLEQVHKGLGEMQALAGDVGDLKRVLSNVKTRGTWGEIQLGALLEQMLAPSQYACNTPVRPGTHERVEYAIRLPGKDDEAVLLPIDAKFPQEAYLRLAEAAKEGDATAADAQGKLFERAIKTEAKRIMEKYIHPPHTTDFAVMYLPTEGLYAEVARRDGLIEGLQREFRVNVAGPSTLTALLNSLQMGFKTLAVEKRTSEVWQLLGEFKKEFLIFSDLLGKTREKLQQAVASMENTERKTRTIDRKLRAVQTDAPLLEAESADVGDMQA